MSDTDLSNLVAYTDRDVPDSLYVFQQPNPDLDARANFRRVEATNIPKATLDAMRREHGQRVAIDDAVNGRHAVAVEENIGVTTSAHFGGDHATPATGVLSRPGVGDTQIGPNPEQHPRTREELEAKAEADAAQPNNVGILSRANLKGNNQIGPDPDQHPATYAEMLSAAEAGSTGEHVDMAAIRGNTDPDEPVRDAETGDPVEVPAPVGGPLVDERPAKRAPAKKAASTPKD